MLKTQGRRLGLSCLDSFDTVEVAEAEQGRFMAPMPGLVTRVLAETGVLLKRNTPVLTMEAMKIVLTLRMPARGRILAMRCAPGDTVPKGVELAEFEPGKA